MSLGLGVCNWFGVQPHQNRELRLPAACSWRSMRICGIRRADEDLIGFGPVPSTKKRGSWHRQSVEKMGCDVYEAARPLLKIQPREDIRLMA